MKIKYEDNAAETLKQIGLRGVAEKYRLQRVIVSVVRSIVHLHVREGKLAFLVHFDGGGDGGRVVIVEHQAGDEFHAGGDADTRLSIAEVVGDVVAYP